MARMYATLNFRGSSSHVRWHRGPLVGQVAALAREAPNGGWQSQVLFWTLGNNAWYPTMRIVDGVMRFAAVDLINGELHYSEPDPNRPPNFRVSATEVPPRVFPAGPQQRVSLSLVVRPDTPNETIVYWGDSKGYFRVRYTRGPNSVHPEQSDLTMSDYARSAGDCLTPGQGFDAAVSPDGVSIGMTYTVTGGFTNPGLPRVRFATAVSAKAEPDAYLTDNPTPTGNIAVAPDGRRAMCMFYHADPGDPELWDLKLWMDDGEETYARIMVRDGAGDPMFGERGCAVDFAPNGDVAVFYADSAANLLRLAWVDRNGNVRPQDEVVWDRVNDGPPVSTGYLDARYDQFGTLHLAYAPVLGVNRAVRYARRAPSGQYTFEDPTGGLVPNDGEYVNLALSTSMQVDPWLTWSGSHGVVLARKLPLIGWTRSFVDASGAQPDLAVRRLPDGTIAAAIAYYRPDVGDLYFTRMGTPGHPSDWTVPKSVDSAGTIGLQPAVELDIAGNPFIAYGRSDALNIRREKILTYGALESKLLTQSVVAPGWFSCVIDDGGYNSTLRLDEYDNPRILYSAPPAGGNLTSSRPETGKYWI